MNNLKQEVLRTGKPLAPVIMLFCVAILGTVIFYSFKKDPVRAHAQTPPSAAHKYGERPLPLTSINSEKELLNDNVRFEAANRLLTLSALFARNGASENAVKYFTEAYFFVGDDIFKVLNETDFKTIRNDLRIKNLMPPPIKQTEENDKSPEKAPINEQNTSAD